MLIRSVYKVILCGALALATGCAKQEKLTQVQAPSAPVLGEIEDDATPQAVLHPGDLVQVVKTARPQLEWKGKLHEQGDEQSATRSGQVVEVRRAPGESTGYAFHGDLGKEVEVPTAKVLCEQMKAGKECAGRLRRIALEGGGLLAYEPCFDGRTCKMALFRGNTVETMPLDGLTDMRAMTLNGQRVALATTRWKKSPVHTGGSTTIVRLEPHLARATEIITEELDATHLTHRLRHGRLSVSPEGLRFVGEEQLTMQNGTDISTKALDETYRLSPTVAK